MTDRKIDLPESCAIISISRCTGRVDLYGSPFTTENFIEIRVQGAEETKGSHGTSRRASPKKTYIRLWLSASQFAQAITTLNLSEGVPCTVRNLGDTQYPEFKFEQQASEKIEFQEEGMAHLKAAIDSLDQAIAAAKEIKLKRERDPILEQLQASRRELADRLLFVGEMFVEYLDNVEQQVKTELAGYCDLAVKDLGMQALNQQQTQSLTAAELRTLPFNREQIL
jgi:hypothetical protein